MTVDKSTNEQAFVREVESYLGRRLAPAEVGLATSLENDKSAAMVARELAGTIIADPKKIRPEHSDTADE